MFNSILIANRGEIACRIIETSKKLNIRTIAVFSEDDANNRHVSMADSSVMIGEGFASTSYLSITSILEAAVQTKAEAIHPGYGFLSENPDFARACIEADLVFVGPSAECIALMSDKAEAKRKMLSVGVPCISGYEDQDCSDSALVRAAEEIGFPIMIKATAGGGGRGMRLVKTKGDLRAALDLTRAEASATFGSDEIMLEKVITGARHVEVQICGDSFGNLVHLGNRDCSVQRRYQKIIEEAPCLSIASDIRDKMADSALQVARAINYIGLGTVEFLIDKNNRFYFLEMNTRIQVEHPVTEMVTGRDLVETQIKIAQGFSLDFAQKDVRIVGHAMEARLYAEDTGNAFLPASGPIVLWRAPSGTGVRVDHGIQEGQNVSTFYDPMLAKIIAWGETRYVARERLTQALLKTVLFGPATNRDFLIAALQKDTLVQGEATTDFVQEELVVPSSEGLDVCASHAALAAVLLYVQDRDVFASLSHRISSLLMNWSSTGRLRSHFLLTYRQHEFQLKVCPDGTRYIVEQGDKKTVLH